MNIYQLIIIIALLGDALLNFIADSLNLKNLSKELPAEFQDLHNAETYASAQEYLRVNTHFHWITSFFNLAIFFIFWRIGGFALLHQWLTNQGWHFLIEGTAYIGIIILGRGLLNLPFRIYSTFVIEEKFGFNRTTWGTFIIDLLKGVLVGAVIGIPLLAAALFFLNWADQWGWLYAWLVTAIILLTVQFVAPRWIMPLFNKFKPLDDEELKSEITDLAARSRFPLGDVKVMDGSRRSSKANAFFSGFGRNRIIALFDTLLNNHTKREIVSVLAHEIGHFRKHHIPLNMILGILHAGILFFLLSILLEHQGLFEAFYITEDKPIHAGLIFFFLLYHPIEMILSILLGILSRRNEYAADQFAVELIGTGENLAEALKKLSRDSLANLTPHPFFVFLNYHHPPVLERIRNLYKLSEHIDYEQQNKNFQTK